MVVCGVNELNEYLFLVSVKIFKVIVVQSKCNDVTLLVLFRQSAKELAE
jgi:hypothetical protein